MYCSTKLTAKEESGSVSREQQNHRRCYQVRGLFAELKTMLASAGVCMSLTESDRTWLAAISTEHTNLQRGKKKSEQRMTVFLPITGREYNIAQPKTDE